MKQRIVWLTCIYLSLLAPGDMFAQHRLLINEVMANPSGAQIPQVEWVELYNPNERAVTLADYSFHYNNRNFSLPNLFLGAKQYAILCAESAAPQLAPYGNVIPLSTWPILSNTGATLLLRHQEHGTVDSVTYSSRWYTTTQKRSGGWSLERVNPDLLCHVAGNWQESQAVQGATPGRRNSVDDQHYQPELRMLSGSLDGDKAFVVFNHEVEREMSVSEVYVDSENGRIALTIRDMVTDTLKLTAEMLLQPHTSYKLLIKGSYCARPFELEHVLFEAQPAVFNDVIINEVLFNPKLGGVDFVELYNRSGKAYNLQDWQIGNRLLAAEPWILDPEQYVLVTTDKNIIWQHYPNAVLHRCIVLPSLPAYANERGIVTIFDQTGQLVDSLYYTSSMHQPFLSNPRGVSLERQSFDRGTNEENNFVSASTASGDATPGYANSKQEVEKTTRSKIFLHNKVVSPDGDGKDDLLSIAYEVTDEHAMLNLHIYDDKGRIVRQVIRNQSVGFNGTFTWDGKAENGADCPSGNYIMWAELYNDRGMRRVFKEAFVLVRLGQGY